MPRSGHPEMDALVVATGNPGKLVEIARILGDRFGRLVSLADLGLPEPDETGTTYAENAVLKAEACCNASGLWSLGDDSGIEVSALGGRPGVASARYAADVSSRNRKLLGEMAALNWPDPSARFVCVVALARPGQETLTFTGTVEGRIIPAPRGSGGFGYDPLFELTNDTRTMAELSDQEKDILSHRGRALAALCAWLDQ